MKALLFFSCYLMVATLVLGDGRNITDEKVSLEGVWELQNQQMYENGSLSETMENENGYRQVKMYSKGKVMWTRNDPSDSNEWFGYGTYRVVDGMLEERLEYASNSMMQIIDTVQVFRFELEMEKNSYSQISLDDKGRRYNSENYDRIE